MMNFVNSSTLAAHSTDDELDIRVEYKKKKLRLLDPLTDEKKLEAALQLFEEEERSRLGLNKTFDRQSHWVENMAGLTFTKSERAGITLLVSGLTMAQDYFVEGSLRGVGYHVQMIQCPDVAALQVGKEFGNRGQCNPTYFTVGNLVKYLCTLRDEMGMSVDDIVKKYVFLTAGACGPCRFGMYVTEFRKALRDAGFEGFRVVLFQQTGGLKQATGDESGLELNPTFFWALIKALMAGDVLNALGYRLRPYETEPGSTDLALEKSKKLIYTALVNRSSILVALRRCSTLLSKVKTNKLSVKPRVSIIGEFWAMTTEGDGNYHLQRFLEKEGAEVDIQLVTAWILYMIWEAKRDSIERENLRGADKARHGLGEKGVFSILTKRYALFGAEMSVRFLFQAFAYSIGLYGYHLPDMDEVARVAHEFYNNELRGGEGHMEVGKLILNAKKKKAHMTLSVKPFGCMPSAGVSDGVQSLITERYPQSIFCPVETSGDGKVNFYSRVQMYLFKAKQMASSEFDEILAKSGVTAAEVNGFLDRSPRFSRAFFQPEQTEKYASTAARLVKQLAPYIKKSPQKRLKESAVKSFSLGLDKAKRLPEKIVDLTQKTARYAPIWKAKLIEDILAYKEIRQQR